MEVWPSDFDFGIFGHEFTSPIGGVLKQSADDFFVTEVDSQTHRPLPRPPAQMYEHGDGGGLYLVGRVWKKDIDHAHMIRLLSKTFRVEEKDISTAGIKDKRAITTQFFSVYQPNKIVQDPMQIGDNIEIDGFSYYREKMYPGRMSGNAFEITIRETVGLDQDKLDNFGSFLDGGILNHYGYQRFGGSRPITAEFGRLILQNKFRDAVDLYLGGKSAGPDEQFRSVWRENRDPDELLLKWTNIPQIEKDILRYLSKRNNDFHGSIRRVPEFLINLSKSAFISDLYNHYISRRGRNLSPLSGERKIDETLHSILKVKNVDNIEIALPSKVWDKPLNDVWKDVFDKFELQPQKDLKQIKHNTRELLTYPVDFEGMVLDENTALVSFQLGTGSYATTILRELMQVLPIRLC